MRESKTKEQESKKGVKDSEKEKRKVKQELKQEKDFQAKTSIKKRSVEKRVKGEKHKK